MIMTSWRKQEVWAMVISSCNKSSSSHTFILYKKTLCFICVCIYIYIDSATASSVIRYLTTWDSLIFKFKINCWEWINIVLHLYMRFGGGICFSNDFLSNCRQTYSFFSNDLQTDVFFLCDIIRYGHHQTCCHNRKKKLSTRQLSTNNWYVKNYISSEHDW